MDSKQKFIKNKYWKRKYHPRKATTVSTVKLSGQKDGQTIKSEEESDDEFPLKQPVPKDGWYPESNSSSSDSEDFKLVYNTKKLDPTLNIVNCNFKSNEADQNWFDKELDNIQLAKEVIVPEKSKNIKEVKDKDISQKNTEREDLASNFNLTKSSRTTDEEEDLEFLLSLKEPVHISPLDTKRSIENERRLTVLSSNCPQQKPIKSTDLEKWLDSVLDD